MKQQNRHSKNTPPPACAAGAAGRRVAPRLEGKVKNRGIKPKKK